jgi:ferritin-like metal-binding protein YciE
MALNSLKDVYIDQLQDLYSSCKQSHGITKKLHDAATNEELKKALSDAVSGIETGMKDLEELCRRHDADPGGEHCKGTEGLVEEARSDVFDNEFGDDDLRDAVIISQYQRLAHYAIAGYGTLLAFAKRIGASEDVATLEKCLDSGYDGDRRMTEIANSGVNAQAA